MSNVKFLYEGVEGSTITASAGTATGYDTENLKDRNPNTLWKANATTNDQTVKFQLPVARAVDTIIIDGHNFLACKTDGISVLVQSSPDGSAWTTRYTFNEAALAETILKAEISTLTLAYWRIMISDTTGLITAPQFGSVLLGTRFEPALPYDADPEHGEKFDTQMSRALDKTPYGSQTVDDGIEQWKNLKWTIQSSAVANGFLKLNHGTRGRLRAFYFCDTDDNIYLVMLVSDVTATKQHRYEQYDIKVEMEAFLPDTIQLP